LTNEENDEEKKYKCPDCPERFRSYQEMNQHYQDYHL
jgi:uncharacterized C2H2 Zn-finger protein